MLLGLKGSLNEYELDLLRHRSLEARREMAKRGELIVSAPVGYIKSEEPSLEKTPDRRVREAIELLFEKVVEIGSVRQTLLWFQEHGLQFPAHTAKSEVQWKRQCPENSRSSRYSRRGDVEGTLHRSNRPDAWPPVPCG